MPRAALLSIHARVDGTEPSTWEDPSLVQLWGPRFSAYVVAARDLAVFSLGRLPDDAKGRRFAQDTADRLQEFLGGRKLTANEAGRGLGVHPNRFQVRRADRQGPHPMGRRPTSDRLDGAPAGGRSSRCSARARAAVPAHLRAGHTRGVRNVGRDCAAAGSYGVRCARRIAGARSNTRWRRLDPRRGRTHVSGSRRERGRRAPPSKRRRALPPPGKRSRAPGPRRRPSWNPLDAPGLAGCRPRPG